MRYLLGVLFLSLFSVVLSAASLLPESWSSAMLPRPGAAGCSSCSRGSSEGNEIPYFDEMAFPKMKVELLEEENSAALAKGLLQVAIGDAAVFSPESRYLLTPPDEAADEKAKKQSFISAKFLQLPLRFYAKFDEIGNSRFYSSLLPGYSLTRDGQYLLITNHNTREEYRFASFDGGKSWKLDSIQYVGNPLSRVSCKYNRDGLVTEILIPGNRRYLLTYKYGQVAKVTSPAGAVTTFEWDEAGSLKRLLTVLTPGHPLYPGKLKSTSRGGKPVAVVRDLYFKCTPRGELQEITNSTGEQYGVKVLTENANGISARTTIVTYPDGSRRYRTNAMGGKDGKLVTDGIVTATSRGDRFIPVKKQKYSRRNGYWMGDGSGTVINEYGGGNLAPTASVDAYGNRTVYTNNECGLQTSAKHPDKSATSTEYDKNWNRVRKTDECGRVKTWEYDATGRLLGSREGELATRYEYDEGGRPVRTVLPGGLEHRFEWDDLSRMTAHRRPGGVVEKYAYCGSLDKIKEVTVSGAGDAPGYTRGYDYDLQGRLSGINYPDGTREQFMYDCCNMIAQRSRAGLVRKHVFNQKKQKVRDVSPSGEVTSYEYDQVGNLKKITYPDGTFTEYRNADDGTMMGKEESNTLPESYANDKMDRLAEVRRADGAVSRRAYDNRGRLSRITGDLARNIAYQYDPSGNIVRSEDWGLPKQEKARTSQYTFDASDRRTAYHSDGAEERTVYVPGSTLIDHTVKDGVYRFMQYDDAGRQISSARITSAELDTATNPEARKRLILSKRDEFKRYDAYGNLAEVVDGRNRLLAKYSFSPDGQLETVLRPTSDSRAELQTYRHYYNQKGEQIFEIYRKNVPMEVKNEDK